MVYGFGWRRHGVMVAGSGDGCNTGIAESVDIVFVACK